MTMDWGEVVRALIIGIPSFLLGYLLYRQSKKKDAVSEESGIASNNRAGTLQIFEGLKEQIDNLQEDNKTLRDENKYLVARLDVIAKELDALKVELARLRRKFGENGPDLSPSS